MGCMPMLLLALASTPLGYAPASPQVAFAPALLRTRHGGALASGSDEPFWQRRPAWRGPRARPGQAAPFRAAVVVALAIASAASSDCAADGAASRAARADSDSSRDLQR